MRWLLVSGGLLLGALALAGCGSGGPHVQARGPADGSTTTTGAPGSTTTTAGAATTTGAPATTAAPATSAAVSSPPCTPELLHSAYAARYGGMPVGTSFSVLKCARGWATTAASKGFDPPSFALYRVEGDHWLALNRSAGRLCEGQGVPADVAPQLGCDL